MDTIIDRRKTDEVAAERTVMVDADGTRRVVAAGDHIPVGYEPVEGKRRKAGGNKAREPQENKTSAPATVPNASPPAGSPSPATSQPAAPPTKDELVDGNTRKELNALAKEAGVEKPEDLNDKGEVADSIIAARTA